jgi:hypothetical protein
MTIDNLRSGSAAYRERAFVKSYLASNGRVDEWSDALDTWTYDASTDCVLAPSGELVKVAWEGSRSKEILAEHQVDETGLNQPDLDDVRDQLSARVRVAMAALPPDDREKALETMREVVRTFLEEEVVELGGPKATVDVVEHRAPGQYVFEITMPRLWPDPVRVEQLSDAEEAYLDDLAAAYFAAPEGTYEERTLEQLHSIACERLGVDGERHMEEASALSSVKEEIAPRLVRLCAALVSTLHFGQPHAGGVRKDWIDEAPWHDVDSSRREWVTAVVVRAASEAEGILGRVGTMPEYDEDMIVQQLIAECVRNGVAWSAFNEAELRTRIREALEEVRAVRDVDAGDDA